MTPLAKSFVTDPVSTDRRSSAARPVKVQDWCLSPEGKLSGDPRERWHWAWRRPER